MSVPPAMEVGQRLTPGVQWTRGPLQEATDASYLGRVRKFIRDTESEAVVLFTPECRAHSDGGDWYGEHLGKWLVTACAAFQRTGDEDLAHSIGEVVRFVIDRQEPDGYLGTYAPDAPCRFTCPNASTIRTWDLWVHAWAILGLLRASAIPGVTGAQASAARIGELLLRTFPDVHRTILDLGNHQGLSSAVLLEPLAELTIATGDPRFLRLAQATLAEMRGRGLFDPSKDVAELGTGKAYQLCWVFVGVAAMVRAGADVELLRDVESLWENIEAFHLTPMGGPWGGVAGHKEVFNAKAFFSPYGFVETCSATSWLHLSRDLFAFTGRARYAEAVEKTLLNTILGAMDVNGEDWCYFTFPNGRRNNTYHWACCKSSGALALELAPSIAVTSTQNRLAINLLVPLRAEVAGFGAVEIRKEPVQDGLLECVLQPETDREFELAIRVPSWAELGAATLNDEPVSGEVRDGYLCLRRKWRPGDRLTVALDCPIRVTPYTFDVDHHGQEVVRMDYACVSRGPYVYATGLIDGYRKEETLRLARLTPSAPFKLADTPSANAGPLIQFHQPGRTPIPFLPYFEAGGRHDGAWRTTWLQVAWQ